jgi:hypothetical protein
MRRKDLNTKFIRVGFYYIKACIPIEPVEPKMAMRFM